MTERLWIFPAILCLLISLTFSEEFLLVGCILCILWFIRILYLKHHILTLLSFIIGVLFIGIVFYHQSTNESHFTGVETTTLVYPKATSIEIDGNSVRFEGTMQNEENVVVQYYFETEAEKELWLENPPIKYLRVEGELVEPAEHSNFYQFNYRKYLKRNKTHWLVKADTITKMEPAESQLSKPTFHYLEKMRLVIFQYIDRMFDDKIGSYLKTLFFADKRGFSEEALQQYRSLGVIHLFSISGFHITYLADLIKQFLLRIGVTHERTNLAVIIILPLYGLLAGLGVSVFRAVLQNVLLLLSKAMKKPLDTLDAWALTMIMALFINPYQIFQIAFQLSYTLSGLFILMSKQKWVRELNALTYSLLFSLMSGIASLPILTYHFFEIPWVTVFANLLFIPFFTYVLFPALLMLLIISFVLANTGFFAFLNKGLALLIRYVEEFLTLLNATFNFSVVTGRLPAVVLLILILSVFYLLKTIEKAKRPKIFPVICLFCSLFYYQLSPVGYVTMLDVGQGDSILIKEPFRQKITLIDTGGSVQWGEQEIWEERTNPFSIGRDVVTPALKAFGISTIDRLYITHAHMDHFGEIADLGQEIKIKEVATTRETFNDPAVMGQLNSIRATTFTQINPPAVVDYPVENSIAIHPVSQNQSKNNHSLVLYVKMGNDKWLFTGDIEQEAEAQLIKAYPNLQVDYLKAGHHGSQTSSTQDFINHIQPKVALISAGKNNTFGHPNEEVLERFENEGMTVYSTSENGAIMQRYLKIPGFDYWLSDRQTVHKD